ncbi:Undecaprenyl-diphosphatase [Magnetococcus marinus MC-1]|uniref:Undecaprenyl-diphosphatase n=1 Tax=Magnetococcus marinus (strain ATCC BAA-1437 / JCM 17883 / MC-1) TaxID=156889 RepID=UPPP_MAGMM|nr:undecaprenyl-diphosphate phosphatase [Magnetococcus marinus]A0L9F4.1 RecName: Full=Undecaprenyl-diphosphatase; AltName: Full=Bacitracin resistance protein; AltName: Full=Undecaprenyl pyrophosphate phosphatase [Magnetococcus marinus MC-1]ABK44597.1 Undecaprenyl-diphosphatase [Magnetococcus marinus MC-1]
MDLFNAAILALIQGITEFLPISSSGHLILTPYLLGWQDQGLVFDIAANSGSLAAVMLYFRREVGQMLRGGWRLLCAPRAWRQANAESHLVLQLALATIPVGLVGLACKDWVATVARDPMIIATTSILFGLLLWWADRQGRCNNDGSALSWRQVGIIGIAQAFALIPGTSRSGVTMTAGLMLGLTREAAARFSFLMAIPVGILAALLDLKDLFAHPMQGDELYFLGVGFCVSGLSAYMVIHGLLAWLKRQTMTPFVVYRVVLGVVIFATLG